MKGKVKTTMRVGLLGNFGSVHYQMPQIEKLLIQSGIETIRLNDRLSFSPISSKLQKLLQVFQMVHRCDIVYGMAQWYNYKWWLVAKLLHKKTANQWIGTDALKVTTQKACLRLAKKTQRFIDVNVTSSKRLQEELESIEIYSQVIPSLSLSYDMNFELEKQPDRHRILVYLDEKRPQFYGSDLVVKLAKKFQNVEFIIVGNKGGDIPTLENLVFKGWVSSQVMKKIYKEISILLRIPKHDGLSMMVLEALAKGKEVIYKYDFPYCKKATNFEEAKTQLEGILNSPPQINYEGHRYIKDNFSKEKAVNKLKEIFNNLL